MRARRPSLIATADEQVSILDACRLIGMDLPESLVYGRNPKVHCPFEELYHRDSGIEAAMRIYVESNHVYCFACGSAYGPVGLVAAAFDISRRQAARELLERAGIRPTTQARMWSEALEHEPALDRAALGEALKTYCRRTIPDWDSRQFEPEAAAHLARCLGVLDHVANQKEARQWLYLCKAIMTRRLAD